MTCWEMKYGKLKMKSDKWKNDNRNIHMVSYAYNVHVEHNMMIHQIWYNDMPSTLNVKQCNAKWTNMNVIIR